VSKKAATALLGVSIMLFGFSAGMLGSLPWKLSPLALFIILGYSFCKRFTILSHFVLGLGLACAPLGVWIALSNHLDPAVLYLALGVLAWTAGFDVLYALQDIDFDRQAGLRSIPALLGVRRALWVSRMSHLVALAAWAQYNHLVGSHLFPWLAWAAVTIILLREAWLMRRGEIEHLDHAFFTLNSFVGPMLLLGHFTEWYLSRKGF
jgi:4-hydroxybenzoate polyprenyltransferase